jgi:uncharacterized membrane protein
MQSEKEDFFFLVAGNVVAFAWLVIVGGSIATFLLLLDAFITGLQAYYIYQREVENDLASARLAIRRSARHRLAPRGKWFLAKIRRRLYPGH